MLTSKAPSPCRSRAALPVTVPGRAARYYAHLHASPCLPRLRDNPMTAPAHELVSCVRFVQLMNEALRQEPHCKNGMHFVNVGSGYDFVAPALGVTANQALDKRVFDTISTKCTIAR